MDKRVKRRPEFQRADICKSVDQALYEIGPLAEDKRITFKSDLQPCAENLYFEPAQIDQVLVNILDNACRFTPRGGSIEIRGYPFFWERRRKGLHIEGGTERRKQSTQDPNAYRVDIRDSGPAVPEEHLEDIFEEYTSHAKGRDRAGGGLGLAICRMILSQHDGRVWAENTAVGPMFSFVLPIRRLSSAQVTKPAASEQKFYREKKDERR